MKFSTKLALRNAARNTALFLALAACGTSFQSHADTLEQKKGGEFAKSVSTLTTTLEYFCSAEYAPNSAQFNSLLKEKSSTLLTDEQQYKVKDVDLDNNFLTQLQAIPTNVDRIKACQINDDYFAEIAVNMNVVFPGFGFEVIDSAAVKAEKQAKATKPTDAQCKEKMESTMMASGEYEFVEYDNFYQSKGTWICSGYARVKGKSALHYASYNFNTGKFSSYR